jgi:hypothetical protein
MQSGRATSGVGESPSMNRFGAAFGCENDAPRDFNLGPIKPEPWCLLSRGGEGLARHLPINKLIGRSEMPCAGSTSIAIGEVISGSNCGLYSSSHQTISKIPVADEFVAFPIASA